MLATKRDAAEEHGLRDSNQATVDAARRGRMHRVLKEQERLATDLTFQPKVNANSKEIAKRTPAFSNENSDYLQRVEYFARRHNDFQEEAVQNMEDGKDASFTPAISNKSDELARSRASRDEETIADKMVRLTYSDKQHNNALKEAAQAEFYSQYTYKPKISRKGERSNPSALDELVNNERAEAVLENTRILVEANFQKGCPFRPSIDKKSQQMATTARARSSHAVDMRDADSLSTSIASERERRERRLQECRASKEFDELNDCTFAPRVNTSPKQRRARRGSAPVVVRGLARHLELRELAKRQRDERDQREHSAFNVSQEVLSAKCNGHVTVPEPFQLGTSVRGKEKYSDASLSSRDATPASARR
jgi:hypothetical protein